METTAPVPAQAQNFTPATPPGDTTPVKKSQKPHPQAVRDACQVLYCQGATPAFIARQFSLPVGTVAKWAERGGWRLLRDELQAQTAKVSRSVVGRSLTHASNELRAQLAEELADQVNALRRAPCKKASELRNTRNKQGRAAVVKTVVESAAAVFGWGSSDKPGLILPMVGDAPADGAPALPGEKFTTATHALEQGNPPACEPDSPGSPAPVQAGSGSETTADGAPNDQA